MEPPWGDNTRTQPPSHVTWRFKKKSLTFIACVGFVGFFHVVFFGTSFKFKSSWGIHLDWNVFLFFFILSLPSYKDCLRMLKNVKNCRLELLFHLVSISIEIFEFAFDLVIHYRESRYLEMIQSRTYCNHHILVVSFMGIWCWDCFFFLIYFLSVKPLSFSYFLFLFFVFPESQ